MGWTSAVLSAAEQADFVSGYPILIGENRLAVSGVWKDSGKVPRPDADYPTYRLYDGFVHNLSKPSVADDEWFLDFNCAAAPITFDCVVIINHNLRTIMNGNEGAFTYRLEIADDAGFSVNSQVIFSYQANGAASGITKNPRLCTFHLFHTGTTARRYTAVNYVRIRLTLPGEHDQIPQMGELWLGYRTQMPIWPHLPYQDDFLRQYFSATKSENRIDARYRKAAAYKVMDACRYTISTDTDKAAVDRFIAGCGYGSKPFLWVEDPLTTVATYASGNYPAEPAAHLMTLDGDSIPFKKTGPEVRKLELAATEQGGLFYASE